MPGISLIHAENESSIKLVAIGCNFEKSINFRGGYLLYLSTCLIRLGENI